MELIARGFGVKVAAIFFFVEWERALQISTKRESGVGYDAIPAFSKRR
jgi:hypothetical protein